MNSRFDNRDRGPPQRRDDSRNVYKSQKKNQRCGIIQRIRSQTGVRSQIVLVCNAQVFEPINILTQAVQRIKGHIRIENEGQDSNNKDHSIYSLYINSERICQGSFAKESAVRKDLHELAIEELRKTCFAVMRKNLPRHSPRVDLDSNVTDIVAQPVVGGIGAKMMAKMGWSGGGLGAQAQGVTDIVQATHQIERQGFGTKVTVPVDKIREILQTYARSDDINSISFSPDFTKEERSVIHSLAQKMNLKSSSYGNGDDRRIVIQKKLDPWQLVYRLFEIGGENDQYQLIVPTKFVNK